MNTFSLLFRQVRRDLAAGEVRLLLVALLLAVTAVTSVSFITDRAQRALFMEANRLLGGDAVLLGDQPLPEKNIALAKSLDLQTAQTMTFNSMLRIGERLRLSELRVLGAGYPLRGQFRLADRQGIERIANGLPDPGTVWLSRRGADALAAKIGDVVELGSAKFLLSAIVTEEPDAVLDYFSVAPKVFLNNVDIEKTGLIQPGSRIGYRLVVAGSADAVETFTGQVRANLERGQRLETGADARPELRNALDRASRFFGLAALVSVVLAAIAVAMAARRHSERHLDACAVMRCLGASQHTIATVQVGALIFFGILGSGLGVLLSLLLQSVLGAWLSQRIGVAVPSAGWLPAVQGFATGMVVLLTFAVPPVLALRKVPALRVLRRDAPMREPSAWLLLLLGLAGLASLLWWKAGSAELGIAMLSGIALTLAILAGLAMLLIVVLRRLRTRLRGPLRYGLANVSRRPVIGIAQISGLGLGIMVLLFLAFVRTDLLAQWQQSLAKNAPNQFIINVQAPQLAPLNRFFAERGINEPTLFPMIRARLTARNYQPVSGDDYADAGERARRLAEREFNLSASAKLERDNTVSAGEFWPVDYHGDPQLSVETRLAQTLSWQIGDKITFDIAGTPLTATITSFRDVEWGSFQPNFFVLVSPGVLDEFSASYITAVRVPETDKTFTAQLIDAFPNVSSIDVGAVLAQVRSNVDRVSVVVEGIFVFSLIAGLLVLIAAVGASQDERLREGAVMRALGGSRRQLRLAQASEFAAIGLIAGGVAALAAMVLSSVVASQVFGLPWQPNGLIAVVGASAGLILAISAGLFATRRVLKAPPSLTLRALD